MILLRGEINEIPAGHKEPSLTKPDLDADDAEHQPELLVLKFIADVKCPEFDASHNQVHKKEHPEDCLGTLGSIFVICVVGRPTVAYHGNRCGHVDDHGPHGDSESVYW